jgi:hypothetical protein
MGSSYAFVLDRPTDAPTDALAIKWSTQIYKSLSKKTSSPITKEELKMWVSQHVWKKSVYDINAIFDLLSTDPAEFEGGVEEVTQV